MRTTWSSSLIWQAVRRLGDSKAQLQAYSGYMYCETSYHLDATFRFKFNSATIHKEILLEYRNLPKSLSVREPIHPIGSKKISRLPPVPAMDFARHGGEGFHCRRCTYSYASSNVNYSIRQSRRRSTFSAEWLLWEPLCLSLCA